MVQLCYGPTLLSPTLLWSEFVMVRLISISTEAFTRDFLIGQSITGHWVTRTCLERGCVRSFHEVLRDPARFAEVKVAEWIYILFGVTN